MKNPSKIEERKTPMNLDKSQQSYEKFFIKGEKMNQSDIEIIPKQAFNNDLDLNEEEVKLFSHELSILLEKKELFKLDYADKELDKVLIFSQIKNRI